MPSAGGLNVGPVADGIQEVSGPIPLISTKTLDFIWNRVFFYTFQPVLCWAFSPWTTNGQQTFLISSFLLREGRSYGIYQRRRNLQYCVYESVSAGIIQTISAGYHSDVLRWSCMAQIGNTGSAWYYFLIKIKDFNQEIVLKRLIRL